MSTKRLMITGASGFVGSHLTKAAAAGFGDQITLIDFIDPLTGKEPDITDRAAMDRVFEDTKPEAVIHLAAMSVPREAKTRLAQAWDVNLIGTLNVAKSIQQFAPDCRLVWAGSSEAYGLAFNKSTSPICETAPQEPANAYGATKAAADMMLRQMAMDGLNAVVIRPFNHSGPGQIPSLVVPAFASQIARIEAGLQPPVVEVGNLEALRDFLDVKDVVHAYLLAALAEHIEPGTSYNVSTGRPIQIAQILDRLIEKSDMAITVKVSPERYSANLVPVASGNWDAIAKDLSWKPQIDFDQTLDAVLDDQRQQASHQSS